MKKLKLFLPMLGLGTLLPVVPTTAQIPVEKGYTLLFEENFDKDTLNTNIWGYRIDRRTGGGYMNGLNRKENVRIKDGILYIDCRHEEIDGQMENTGGGIITKQNFGYGYYECRSKPFMAGKGIHTSFWQTGGTNPRIFEIDSYEIDSKSYMGCNNLYVDLGSKEKRTPWPHRAQIPFTTDAEGWWVDAYEYTPRGIHFYDNGQEVAFCEWQELNAHQAVWLTALNGCGTVETDKLPAYSAFDYFRFYAKDYPGVTILPNGSFEYNQDKIKPGQAPVCWNINGTKNVVNVVKGDAFRDNYKLTFSSDKDFSTQLNQKLDYIMDGDYILSAMVRCNTPKATLSALSANHTASVNIPLSNKWKAVSVPVKVADNSVTISIGADGKSGQWLEIDNVEFMKPLKKGEQPIVKTRPFGFYQDAVWELAMEQPIPFVGDDKFYFFDRIVGIGDQITVAMTVNSDVKANATPIARIPKTGKSGWALQLTADGGVIFRIGSIADHHDVYAPNAYKPGVDAKIACVYDNGTVSIYSDGKLLKKESGIQHKTDDKTAAGRLGTVGEAYEAVSDVIQDMGVKDVETHERMNYRGKLSKIQIFNRVAVK